MRVWTRRTAGPPRGPLGHGCCVLVSVMTALAGLPEGTQIDCSVCLHFLCHGSDLSILIFHFDSF